MLYQLSYGLAENPARAEREQETARGAAKVAFWYQIERP